jgi:hypothetical protein
VGLIDGLLEISWLEGFKEGMRTVGVKDVSSEIGETEGILLPTIVGDDKVGTAEAMGDDELFGTRELSPLVGTNDGLLDAVPDGVLDAFAFVGVCDWLVMGIVEGILDTTSVSDGDFDGLVEDGLFDRSTGPGIGIIDGTGLGTSDSNLFVGFRDCVAMGTEEGILDKFDNEGGMVEDGVLDPVTGTPEPIDVGISDRADETVGISEYAGLDVSDGIVFVGSWDWMLTGVKDGKFDESVFIVGSWDCVLTGIEEGMFDESVVIVGSWDCALTGIEEGMFDESVVFVGSWDCVLTGIEEGMFDESVVFVGSWDCVLTGIEEGMFDESVVFVGSWDCAITGVNEGMFDESVVFVGSWDCVLTGIEEGMFDESVVFVGSWDCVLTGIEEGMFDESVVFVGSWDCAITGVNEGMFDESSNDGTGDALVKDGIFDPLTGTSDPEVVGMSEATRLGVSEPLSTVGLKDGVTAGESSNNVGWLLLSTGTEEGVSDDLSVGVSESVVGRRLPVNDGVSVRSVGLLGSRLSIGAIDGESLDPGCKDEDECGLLDPSDVGSLLPAGIFDPGLWTDGAILGMSEAMTFCGCTLITAVGANEVVAMSDGDIVLAEGIIVGSKLELSSIASGLSDGTSLANVVGVWLNRLDPDGTSDNIFDGICVGTNIGLDVLGFRVVGLFVGCIDCIGVFVGILGFLVGRFRGFRVLGRFVGVEVDRFVLGLSVTLTSEGQINVPISLS